MYSVKDKHNNHMLSDKQIIEEINRDRSSHWSDYTIQELKNKPSEVLAWIDENYYEVTQ
jgi:hypothetical protein